MVINEANNGCPCRAANAMKYFIAPLLLLSTLLGLSAAETNLTYTGDWSEATNGLRARLSITDTGRIQGKIRYSIVSLELQNVSELANPINFYFDDQKGLHAQLVSASGKPPEPVGEMASERTVGPYWLTLPQGGMLKFPISAHGYSVASTNAGLAVNLHGQDPWSHVWVVPDSAAEDHFLAAWLEINPGGAASHPNEWRGILKFPPVRIPARTP